MRIALLEAAQSHDRMAKPCIHEKLKGDDAGEASLSSERLGCSPQSTRRGAR